MKNGYGLLLLIAMFHFGCVGQQDKSRPIQEENYPPNEQRTSVSKNKRKIHIEADTIYDCVPDLVNFKLYLGEKLVFIDTVTTYVSQGKVRKLTYNDTIFYLLLRIKDPSSRCDCKVLRCENDSCVDVGISIFDGFLRDLDNDGLCEAIVEEWSECVSRRNGDCDSCSYDPVYVYRFGYKFEMDTAYSRILTEAKYGFCIDFDSARHDMIVKCGTLDYERIPIYLSWGRP